MSSSRRSLSRSRSRSRDRDRERDIPPANTNSSDPKLLFARLFIGNLATDKVSRSELVNIFGKYGRVLGISLFRGYGFIQYESEEEARAAITGESGVNIKGQRIDVKMAAEGRKKGGGGGGGGPPRHNSPPPRGPRGGRDRSPVRGSRDPYADDPYDEPPRRGPPRDSYGRNADPYAPPPSSRYPPAPTPRDPYADPYAREPYPPRDPYVRAPPPPQRPAAPLVADCEIISFTPKIRGYVDAIERRLRAISVVGHQLPLSSPDSLPKALEDITRRGMLYAIIVNEQNEQHRSLTLNILHGTPQEHRNMPYEDAITLIQRNYEEYRKKKAEASAATVATTPAATPASSNDFLKPDSKQAYLLNLLADNRFLTLEELDTVIQYLTLRREHQVQKDGKPAIGATAAVPTATAVAALTEETAIVQQQQALQARILNILGGSSASGKTGVTATPASQAAAVSYAGTALASYAAQPPPPPKVAPPTVSSATNINFNNPSVQKALNNLISTGGIKSVQQPPPAPVPVATPAAAAAAYGQQQYAAYQQQYAAAYAGQQQQQPPPPPTDNGNAAAAAVNYAAAVSGYQYPGY